MSGLLQNTTAEEWHRDSYTQPPRISSTTKLEFIEVRLSSPNTMSITSVKFWKFKAFREYSVSLSTMNVLVGPNNSGKSTILSAFRVLEQGLRTARSKRSWPVNTHLGRPSMGHLLPEDTIPISLENVHSDYDETDSRIEFRYSTGNKIYINFPSTGGVTMYWEVKGKSFSAPSAFRRAFPDEVQTIPVLGPVEPDEPILEDRTVKSAAGTPRASRHFRNYWWKYPQGFDDFQRLIEHTWPGMKVSEPELRSAMDNRLIMFVSEKRMTRELYWSGLGFQVWCQLLTHISRCSHSNLLIIDEPEVYLHPEVQRQLLGILRDVRPDILLATHSVEILGEADPGEILLVDKSKKSARRLREIEGVQQALDSIGSIHNITLAELARNRRVLFVEGPSDFKIIRRFSRILGFKELSAGVGIAPVESGGYNSWEKIEAFAWGLENTLGSPLIIGAIFDHDYRSEEEMRELETKLQAKIQFVHIHDRKEIENYLLNPDVLKRAAMGAINDRYRREDSATIDEPDMVSILESITSELRSIYSGQYISNYYRYFKSSGKDQATLNTEALRIFDRKWSTLESRLKIVSGKDVLKAVRDKFQHDYQVTLTDFRIIDSHRRHEVPDDLVTLVEALDVFRSC